MAEDWNADRATLAPEAPALTQSEIDQRVFELYDEYCHGNIDRREFLQRASVLTVGGLAMAQALLPRYALAQTISFTDPRIKARYLTYPSPGGTSGTMRAYLVQPNATGPFPAVLVIHENRGLNPYIEDVARRVATEGFLALAPDVLSPVGGYPGNADDGRALQAGLDQGKLRTDMVNSARFLKAHALSAGRLGVTGFCWGGSPAPSMAFTTTRHRVTTRRRPSWPGSGRSPSSRSTLPEAAVVGEARCMGRLTPGAWPAPSPRPRRVFWR